MRIHKFSTTDAFVAIDLEGAEAASGPVRWARKVLQGGAKDLARSQTYTYAALGMRRGGASAGISAEGPDRAAALRAFTAEAADLVGDHTYLPDAAKGIAPDELTSLHAADPRDTARLGEFGARCEGLSAAVTAEQVLAGLDGRRVSIDGFDASGPALAAAVTDRGATIVSISTAKGCVTNGAGFPLAVLAESWNSNGHDLVSDLGEVGAATEVFAAGADVVFAGSKMGIIDHGVAAGLANSASAVIPIGRLPFTARALAVLRRADVIVPADFVSLAGSTIAAWGDPSRGDDEIVDAITASITDLCAELAGHPDGPLLAACYHAEAYLSTWQTDLPFGRPLAP